MEKLTVNTKVEILSGFSQQNFYLCPAQNLESLVDEIAPTSEYFGLLLAVDGRSIDSDRVRRAAGKLIRKGLASLCTWGPDCERIHDVFDHVAVELDRKHQKAVIMTTWHDDESLQEAIWYFMYCAVPDSTYQRTCQDWIFAPIASADWENIMRVECETPRNLEEN